MSLHPIEDALADFRAGRMIIVVDDEDRENEGDLTIAASKVTPETINFMAKHGRGLICLPMTAERLAELHIPPMVTDNTSNFGTAFTVSIEARDHVTTGISAADRAATILAAVDPHTKPSDLARPGHVFPIRARAGGVLERAGQTEAAVDLARIAGLYPAGVICEIMNEDGTMARMAQLVPFARQFGLKIISIADLIQYRLRTEKFVFETERAVIPTEFGDFLAIVFQSKLDNRTHLALVKGDIRGPEPVYLRVQTQSIPGDVFLSRLNPSGQYLHRCLQFIARKKRGVVLYLRLDLDGERLSHEIHACQRMAEDPNYSYSDELFRKEDRKEYGIGAQILNSLGLREVILLTAHPRKLSALPGYGIEIIDQMDAGAGKGIQYVSGKKTKDIVGR
jgi:3,4-dihydroxy 2-butanone 4-phosphate synthase / GTP cyclohydrolase II